MKLDDYEKELLEHEDELLAKARMPTNKEKTLLMEAVRNTLSKDKRINIRMSSRDLAFLQRRANRSGMPYQTIDIKHIASLYIRRPHSNKNRTDGFIQSSISCASRE